MNKKLTPKQDLFCQEYLKDFNATKAAIRAGYSEKSAYSTAHEILKKPEIKEKIEAYSRQLFSQIGVNTERILGELVAIAFSEETQPQVKIKALEILLERKKEKLSSIETFRENAQRVLGSLARFRNSDENN